MNSKVSNGRCHASWSYRCAAILFLAVVDCGLAVHRMLPRHSRKIFLLIATAVLGAVAAIGVISLSRIGTDSDLLIRDAIMGIDSASEMRAVAFKTQMDLLSRSPVAGDARSLTEAKQSFANLLDEYRAAAFLADDKANADSLQRVAAAYFAAAISIHATAQITGQQRKILEDDFSALEGVIAQAIAFNSARLWSLANDVKHEAGSATVISLWLCGGLVAAALLVFLLVFLDDSISPAVDVPANRPEQRPSLP